MSEVVYLLHLVPAYRHAQHYVGTTRLDRLAERLQEHHDGRGARLLQVAVASGSTFRLVRLWEGGQARERAIKRVRHVPRRCPVCMSRDGRAFLPVRQAPADAALDSRLALGEWSAWSAPGCAICAEPVAGARRGMALCAPCLAAMSPDRVT